MAVVVDRRMARNRRLDAERRRLVERHVRLAEKIARKRCRWGQEDPDDTRSDALWGLTLAGRAFRPGSGNFATYAALRIDYAIRRGRQVRSGLPRSAWERSDRPTLVSLNAPVGTGGGELIDLLPAPSDSDEDSLTDALRRLPARECLVVRLRYYRGLTQSEVAPIIGRSQMQVSRIERQALTRLRDSVCD